MTTSVRRPKGAGAGSAPSKSATANSLGLPTDYGLPYSRRLCQHNKKQHDVTYKPEAHNTLQRRQRNYRATAADN